MRLHSLEVTAFGPFRGREEIDFEELNDAGLFLLTGPTGAGKTSILDAICFALYGSVPGVRGVKMLKSQHAAPDARPEVVLDFSIGERRFILRRTPEWTRPKRRGDGMTEEKSSASLIELTSGLEHMLSSRAQEVGHQITELIGMNASQFVQVAMLPQGDFQRFLRATSQERHDVLQHLFKTDRFSRIEDWVQDHSKRLSATASAGQSSVQRILDTIADRAGVQCPEQFATGLLSAAATEGNVLPWAVELFQQAEHQQRAVALRHEQICAAVARARTVLTEATAHEAASLRQHEASVVLDRLAQTADDAKRAQSALDNAVRAAGCRTLLGQLDAAELQHARTARLRTEALSELSAVMPTSSPPVAGPTAADLATLELTAAELTTLEQSHRARITRLEMLLPREQVLSSARREVEQAIVDLDATVVKTQKATQRQQEEIPQQVHVLEQRLEHLQLLTQRKEALTVELGAASTKLAAARQVPESRTEAARTGEDVQDARDRTADAREHMQDVIARRLAGIAAELAGRLAPGRPCQVCGATEHPQLAQSGADAVTEREQEEATAAFDHQRAEHDRSISLATKAHQRLASLLQAAGGLDAAAALALERDLTAQLRIIDEAETALTATKRSLAVLAGELKQADLDLADLRTLAVTLELTIDERRRTIEEVASELEGLLSEGQASLTDALAETTHRLSIVQAALVACQAHEQDSQHLASLNEQSRAAVEEHGFASLTALREAALSPAERDAHQRLLAERSEQRSVAEAALADESLEQALMWTGDGVDAARADLQATEAHEKDAARVLHQHDECADALRSNLTRLKAVLDDWAPARDRFVRAESMSKLVRGMSGDNQLQMRLSAYVLATRLDQVVAAANERLAHMRDQRYLLERTGKSARRGTQSGLGLQVVDEWTGDVRDPATLSGGETFVVSLSLALGLADVVTQEAGGTDIETLFIDEGFGMLDPDTLDDVMDRLDGLRAGGRTVGVVSHVSELRNRIPTQVHVEKSRTGSSIAVRTLIA